jgi:uridylate kinase
VLEKQLRVMDLTAITLCKERKIPLVVFNMKKHGNIARVVRGEMWGRRSCRREGI